MAKFDKTSAYRNVAILPQDRSLLGMKWHDKCYVDMALLFGLRPASYIFTSTADMVEWILTHNYGVQSFVTTWMILSHWIRQPLWSVTTTCRRAFALLHSQPPPSPTQALGGPMTRLSILGIELNSTTLQARLPVE